VNLQALFDGGGNRSSSNSSSGVPFILNATETTLTANQSKQQPEDSFAFPFLTISPMEVRTFLAFFE